MKIFNLCLVLFLNVCAHAAPATMALNKPDDFTVSSGSLGTQNETLRWQVNNGQSSTLALSAPLANQLTDYDVLSFDWRIGSGEISSLELNILGNETGPRRTKIHNWTLGLLTTPRGEWQSEVLEMARPGWFPWDEGDGHDADKFLRLQALALAPDTVLEIRNFRLTRALVRLKPDFELPISWPVLTRNADGSATYRTTYQVQNSGNAPTEIEALVLSKHAKFVVAFDKPRQSVKNADTAEFVLTATISATDIAATPELGAEPLKLAFRSVKVAEAAWEWNGFLTRPLSPNIERQVIVAQSTLKMLRAKLDAGDVAAKQVAGYDAVIKRADEFIKVRLDAIPGSHSHPKNRIPVAPDTKSKLQPGDFMPEVVEPKSGFREVGTPLADQFWKEYLGQGGAAENLGLAYLLSGDEKYAAHAAKLFALYGEQYADLDWNSGFEPVWSDGPAILSSSRVANSSTYGSNWFFKNPLKLLSMIADSPSWKAADKQKIYEGFALPYATELMKFPGSTNNMTDISNANVLLLGLVFDDANLVHWATQRDAGLFARLGDLDADGFSSEGRPVNYHLAAMDEYLASLAYLENSGLKLDYPKDRLLAAIRMPFQRATLSGDVPISGDMGRGFRVRNSDLADELYPLFPKEKWLLELGNRSTLRTQVEALQSGARENKDGWKSLLETEPRLYKNAGFAILRNGDKIENQIMATLDWGRNPVHGAFDRNQFTLSAFGLIFSAGPGSLYNAGSGGTRSKDARLNSFAGHGSLGHNVILVDGADQQPAAGKLLKWSDAPDDQFVISHVEGIAQGVAHTRGVFLREGIVVILDRVTSKEQHQYDWIYRNLGEMKTGDGWTQSAVKAPLGDRANYENLIEPKQLNGAGALRLNWDLTGQSKTKNGVGLALWQLPTSGEMFTATTGMNNPNTSILPDAAPTLIHRVRGKTAEFATVLEPHQGASRVAKVERAGTGVKVTLKSGETFAVSLSE